MSTSDYPIYDVAQAAGTTSRTLRHYDAEGLLPPTRVGANGTRYYDDAALRRLQRILMLRDLGVSVASIRDVLETQDTRNEAEVLGGHLELLRQEKTRIERQIQAVERTLAVLTEGTTQERSLMEHDIYDGFDHTQHRDEVEARWGKRAYDAGDRWWRELGADGQRNMQLRVAGLNQGWQALASSGERDPHSRESQALAARHLAWLREVPGTPEPFEDYVRGLADMYVADPRFAANYGGTRGAEFVRAALLACLDAD